MNHVNVSVKPAMGLEVVICQWDGNYDVSFTRFSISQTQNNVLFLGSASQSWTYCWIYWKDMVE